ncbi:MAG: hypothetical protein DRP78_01640, partial [Candidatus Omnitrophota bacterium]
MEKKDRILKLFRVIVIAIALLIGAEFLNCDRVDAQQSSAIENNLQKKTNLLQKEIKQLNILLNKKNQEAKKADKKINILEMKCEMIEDLKKEIQQACQDRINLQSNFERQIKQLKQSLQAAQKRALSGKYKNNLDKLQNKTAKMSTQIKTLDAKKKKIERELTAKLNELRDKIGRINKENVDFKKQIDLNGMDLLLSKRENKQLEEEYAVKTLKFQNIDKTNLKLAEKVQQLTNKLKDKDKLARGNKKVITDLETQITVFKEQAQDRLSQLKKLESENKGTKGKWIKEIASLQDKLKQMKRSLNIKGKEIGTANQELKQLRARESVSIKQTTELNTKLNTLSADAVKLSEQLREAKDILSERDQEIARINKKSLLLDAKLAKAKLEKESVLETHIDLKKEVKQLKAKLGAVEADKVKEANELKTKIKDLLSSLSIKDGQISAVNQELAQLKVKKGNSVKQVSELNTKLNTLSADAVKLSEQLRETKDVLSKKDQEIARINKKSSLLDAKLAKAKLEKESVLETHIDLKKEVKQLK